MFFSTHTAAPEIYTLSLHDALPIYPGGTRAAARPRARGGGRCRREDHRSCHEARPVWRVRPDLLHHLDIRLGDSEEPLQIRLRSEERRVGKESRSGWLRDYFKTRIR